MKVTPNQLWVFCHYYSDGQSYDDFMEEADCCDGITSDLFEQLKEIDLKVAVSGQEMSEGHFGGDDILDFIAKSLKLVENGYKPFLWYGDGAEVLVVGYRPCQLIIEE